MDSYALALVHAWLVEHPEHYCAWVRPYSTLRYRPSTKAMERSVVGGHWRRLPLWKNVIPALRCTAKFEVIGRPSLMEAPPRPVMHRWDEEGHFIPRSYRVWVFMP